tara:strand:+ start:1861 stop:2049 length:189 start_codon:yes stop_codon:yes gene_type:complete
MDINDTAYEIASGAFLTQALTQNELQDIVSSEIPLERFEHWSEEMLDDVIENLAEEIIERFA